jgi:hypothetical protein
MNESGNDTLPDAFGTQRVGAGRPSPSQQRPGLKRGMSSRKDLGTVPQLDIGASARGNGDPAMGACASLPLIPLCWVLGAVARQSS